MTDVLDLLRTALDEETAGLVLDPRTVRRAVHQAGRRRAAVLVTAAAVPVTAGLLLYGGSAGTSSLEVGISPSPAATVGEVADVDGVRVPVPPGYVPVVDAGTFRRDNGSRVTVLRLVPRGIVDTGTAPGTVRLEVTRGPDARGVVVSGRSFTAPHVEGTTVGSFSFNARRLAADVVLTAMVFDDPQHAPSEFLSGAVDTGAPGDGPVTDSPTSGPLG